MTYCSWNSTGKSCGDRTCADVKCSGTAVNAYTSGSSTSFIFCTGGTGSEANTCVSGDSSSVSDSECNTETRNTYR